MESSYQLEVASRARGEGYVRCCYASSYEQIERALERIGRFVQRVR